MVASETIEKVRAFREKSDEIEASYRTFMAASVSAELQDSIFLMMKSYFLMSVILESPENTTNRPDHDVLHLLMTRVMKTFRSITVLIADGCEQDATALLRNLTETFFTIKYIGSDRTGKLSKRFKDFAAVERQNQVVYYRRYEQEGHILEPPFDSAHTLKFEEDFKAYLAEHSNNTTSWSGLGMRKLAGQLKMPELYLRGYSMYCAFTHPSYLSKPFYAYKSFITWIPTFERIGHLSTLAVDQTKQATEVFLSSLGSMTEPKRYILHEIDYNVASRMMRLEGPIKDKRYDIPLGKWGISPILA